MKNNDYLMEKWAKYAEYLDCVDDNKELSLRIKHAKLKIKQLKQ